VKKKRILKDPETGEIVGATRTPFSHKAKELNKQIFAEKFEKSRLERENSEKVSGNKNYLFLVILAILAALAFVIWKGVGVDDNPKDSSPAGTTPSEP
jgi:hypothetical protein